MLFNSYIFIFLFFPVCMLGFYLLKHKSAILAKIWLTGFSLWFYGYFNIRYLCIMLFSIIINYVVYLFMKQADNAISTQGGADKQAYSVKKCILAAGVSANLLLLFYFKYFDFFVENINAVFRTSIALRNILLPLGISFFTFQQISFLADTYRGELKECNFVDYALFVSFFPQLIAGPIVTHEEMLPQFQAMDKTKFKEDVFVRGIYIFVLGMAKKVLIADTFGLAVDAGYGMVQSLGSVDAVLVMVFYTLQLYYDFSGYCDMAIGLGKMMGIEIAINFNSPYKACNIIEFWKRWHITLSRFFTKNIYIPLGGNRKGPVRMYANLFLVFFLSGVWHGAGWNFILWGVMHGVLYCVTRWWQLHAGNRKTERGHVWIHACKVFMTFLYVNIAWVFFRSESIGQAFALFKRMIVGGIALPSEAVYDAFNLDEFWYIMKVLHLTDFAFSPYILMISFTVIILLLTFWGKNVQELAKASKMSVMSAMVIGIVFVWCVLSLSGVSTFLYFNF